MSHSQSNRHVRVDHGRAEVVVVGSLGAVNTAAFLRIVQSLLDGGARTVVVDLAQADVDAAGIEALAIAESRVRRQSGKIVLQAPCCTTLRLLEDAGILGRFLIT